MVSQGKYRLLAWLSAAALFGCGDASLYVCVGDPRFCNHAATPVANPGPDQTVAEGDAVTLDGSNSQAASGTIRSYSWTQTSGPAVTLSNANQARASFIAPNVTSSTGLLFQLTVVDSANRADTGSTLVTVQPRAAAALSRAIELFAGPLQPSLAVSTVAPGAVDGCPSSTLTLPPDQAAVQRGFWLAGRSIAFAKGLDAADPGAFLEVSRASLAEHPMAARDVAGQIESFGYMWLGTLTRERDPALHVAVTNRLQGAATPDDPAGLLSGRIEVRHVDGIAIEAVQNPALSSGQAVARLLASRFACVEPANVLDVTAAGLRVIADSDLVPRAE